LALGETDRTKETVVYTLMASAVSSRGGFLMPKSCGISV